MNQTQNQQKQKLIILERLSKLQELAARPGTPDEAIAATDAIERLLLKYNLTEADIEAHQTKEKNSKFVCAPVIIDTKESWCTDWKHLLLAVIAEHHFCCVLTPPDSVRLSAPENKVLVAGTQINVTATQALYAYLSTYLKKMEHEEHTWRQQVDIFYADMGEYQQRKRRDAYAIGLVTGIDRALNRQRTDQLKEAGANAHALVVQLREELIDELKSTLGVTNVPKEEMDRLYRKMEDVTQTGAYYKGIVDGQEVPLNERQLNATDHQT